MENKKLLEILEKQINRLEEIQEVHSGNTALVLEVSNSIREHVNSIRMINIKLKHW